MNETNSLLTVKDYGKINLRLKEIMDEKKIMRNTLAKAAHTRFEVIDKWYNNDVSKLDLDILARICFVLDCSVSDIIEYKENRR